MDARAARFGCGLLLPLAGLAACGGAGSGAVVVPGPVYDVVYEIEPNDAAFLAQPIGTLAPGDDVLIQGSICGVFCDPVDGYATIVYGPCAIDFELAAASSFADFDLALFDPALGVFTAVFESGGPIEAGSIVVQSYVLPLQLVVLPFAGDGPYSLALHVSPIFLASDGAAAEPAALPVRPRGIGASPYASDAAPAADLVEAEVVAEGIAIAFDEHGAVAATERIALLAPAE